MRKHVANAARMVLAITVALGFSGAVDAGEKKKWSFELEPTYTTVHGHDQHVLTVRETDLDSTPPADSETAVNLDTDSGVAYRAELRYNGKQWGWGVDLFWFDTSQTAADRTAAAEGPSGTVDEVVFQLAGREFTSSDPGEVLFYGVLEDTDLAAWTVDLYGTRTLADSADSGVHMQFGLRFADFDNDYRAVAGIQDVRGTRWDASSNYDRMMGPLVGLAGDVQCGKSHIEGYIGQSLLLGSAELFSMSREFTGPFGSSPSFSAQDEFRKDQDVAIPVTEFRVKWTYRISKTVALGLGANTSAWWDVPVPPGVIPTEDGDVALHENTLVFFGMLGAVDLTF